MARFSSFIRTERNSEVCRLGNKDISSRTFATEVSVAVTALAFPDAEKKEVTHERVWVEILNGSSQCFYGETPFFTIDDGIIKLPENFIEIVEKHNNELIKRRRNVENLK